MNNCIQGAFSSSGGAATVTAVRAELSSDFTTTSTTFTDLTGMTVDVSATSGSFLCHAYFSSKIGSTTSQHYFRIVNGTTDGESCVANQMADSGQWTNNSISLAAENDEQTVKIQTRAELSATLTVGGSTDRFSAINLLEVS